MRNKLFALALVAISVFSFTSCSDDNDDYTKVTDVYPADVVGYVAAAGNYGQNNGTVGAINFVNNVFGYSDIYTAKNGKGIGDAQDVLPLNGMVYVTCTTSSKVEVLASDGTVKKSILMRNNQQPRYLATDGKAVYFSAYSGYVYKMTYDDGIVDSVAVGSHPEAMSVANGKLYVNMSDYNYYNTGDKIAVVDLATFKKTKNLTCELNPYNQSIAVGNKVYFVSVYHSQQPGQVQCIDATTDAITKVCNASAIAYNPMTNSLICINSYYDANYSPVLASMYVHNLTTGKDTQWDASAFESPQQVNVDPHTGNIYIIDNPSYSTPSVLYIFDKDGKLLKSQITMGYSVQNIRFVD